MITAPVDSFDVDGVFDFRDDLSSNDDYRKDAIDARPDLKAALLSVQQAETNYKLAEADGSTDPTIGVWFTHNGSFNNPDALNTIGASVNIPLRIFDTNQGEKLRTKIDIKRNEKLRQGVETQVYSDVDSAYASVTSDINLLKPYKSQYLEQAVRVRDTVQFSYQHGGAALLDFLNAESEYRAVAVELRKSGRFLSDSGGAVESGRGARGYPMNKILLAFARRRTGAHVSPSALAFGPSSLSATGCWGRLLQRRSSRSQ